MGRVWALGPTDPSCFGQGCVWQKTLLCLFHVFLFPFYFDIWPNKPIFDIKKIPKYLETIVDSFVAPSHFVLFFSLCVCIFYAMCSINGALLLNAKFVV